MQLLRNQEDLLAWRRLDPQRPVHFVPTMGSLHLGHQQLIRRARQPRGGRVPRVLVSVFVNPLQFGPGEDFARYPRDLAGDAQLAAAAGADALLAPDVALIYPHGLEGGTRLLAPEPLQRQLCGRSRPGHFDGVATVVVFLMS